MGKKVFKIKESSKKGFAFQNNPVPDPPPPPPSPKREQVSIKIGEFTIWSQSALGDPSKIYIWRNGKYGSEGGDFSKEKLNKMLSDFWDKEF